MLATLKAPLQLQLRSLIRSNICPFITLCNALPLQSKECAVLATLKPSQAFD